MMLQLTVLPVMTVVHGVKTRREAVFVLPALHPPISFITMLNVLLPFPTTLTTAIITINALIMPAPITYIFK